MTYTARVEHAIREASALHDGQTRKGKNAVPYISHLFSVAAILSNYTADEDIIIAGLLHDSIEDTDYTEKELKKEFGNDVATIVMGVTELKKKDGVELLWKERKEAYLDLLREVNEQSLMVAAADKIHNLQSVIYERKTTGETFWSNGDYDKSKDQLWFFGETLAILKERLHNKIVNELEALFAEAETVFQKDIVS